MSGVLSFVSDQSPIISPVTYCATVIKAFTPRKHAAGTRLSGGTSRPLAYCKIRIVLGFASLLSPIHRFISCLRCLDFVPTVKYRPCFVSGVSVRFSCWISAMSQVSWLRSNCWIPTFLCIRRLHFVSAVESRLCLGCLDFVTTAEYHPCFVSDVFTSFPLLNTGCVLGVLTSLQLLNTDLALSQASSLRFSCWIPAMY